MEQDQFILLGRFYDGEKISRIDLENATSSEPRRIWVSIIRAFDFLIQEKLIQPSEVHVDNNTRYEISALGKITREVEEMKWAEKENNRLEKIRIDGLQVQLLELSIKTSASSLITDESLRITNNSVIGLNKKTEKYYKRLNLWTMIVAIATGLYAISTFWQAKIANDSLQVQKKQSEHRPKYIEVKGTLQFPKVRDTFFRIQVQPKPSGKDSAHP